VRLSGGAVTRTSARVIESDRSGRTYVPEGSARLVLIDSSIEYLQSCLRLSSKPKY
jgi:hypothetical protein